MSASMMCQKLDSALEVDLPVNSFTDKVYIFRHFLIDFVEDTFANLDSVDNLTEAETFDI